jgi:hypothetical protein
MMITTLLVGGLRLRDKPSILALLQVRVEKNAIDLVPWSKKKKKKIISTKIKGKRKRKEWVEREIRKGLIRQVSEIRLPETLSRV